MPEIPFSDLMKQAEKVYDKTGKFYTTVSVKFVQYQSGSTALRYELCTDGSYITKEYDTAQELQQAMENILNPPTDKGVFV